MATVKVRYLTQRNKKNGQTRYFWQPSKALANKGWKLTRLSDDKAEAMSQAEQINAQVDEWRAGELAAPTTARPGTVEDLIEKYKNSSAFTQLAAKTRKDYTYYLDKISVLMGDQLAISISAKIIQDIYETLHGQRPAQAAYLVRVIRILFNYAERRSIIPKGSNPATKPNLRYKAEKGRLWTPRMIAALVDTADRNGFYAIGTAVYLNEWLGQRRGDVIRLRIDAYRDGKIFVKQSKTSAEVYLPVDDVPHLKQRLHDQLKKNKARATPGTTIIQREDGTPFTDDHFTKMFRRLCKLAECECPEIKGMKFMDLRQTAVSRLTESGSTIQEIAAVTGHSFKACEAIVDRYNIRTTKAAENAFTKRREAEGK